MHVTELAEEKFVGINTLGYNSKLKSDILYSKVGNGNEFDFFANLCTLAQCGNTKNLLSPKNFSVKLTI